MLLSIKALLFCCSILIETQFRRIPLFVFYARRKWISSHMYLHIIEHIYSGIRFAFDLCFLQCWMWQLFEMCNVLCYPIKSFAVHEEISIETHFNPLLRVSECTFIQDNIKGQFQWYIILSVWLNDDLD